MDVIAMLYPCHKQESIVNGSVAYDRTGPSIRTPNGKGPSSAPMADRVRSGSWPIRVELAVGRTRRRGKHDRADRLVYG